MDFFGIGPLEILLILTMALIVFGPQKLPEIGRNLGKAVNSFKKAASEMTTEMSREIEDEEIDQKHLPAQAQTKDKSGPAATPKTD